MANEYDEQSTFEEDIEAILTTDPVQGDPPGFSGTLTGKINVVLFHIVNRTRWLKNTLESLNITVPNASTTTKGIAELATKAEAEAATDTTRITPPKRVLDLLRAVVAQATETVRGTVRRATQSEAEGGTNNEKVMTPQRTQQAIDNRVRSSVHQASTTRQGTAELTTKAEAESGTDNTRIMTSLRTKELMRHSNAQATTSQRGTVKKATQQQVSEMRNDENYITPADLGSTQGSYTLSGSTSSTGGLTNISVTTDVYRTGKIIVGTINVSGTKNSTGSYSVTYTFDSSLGQILFEGGSGGVSVTSASISGYAGGYPHNFNKDVFL